MLRRLVMTVIATALLGAGLGTVPADAAAGNQPWRVSTRCTQAGVLKVRMDHDLNVNGKERISSDFKVFTASGFQTWDFKTKLNGVVFQQGAATTDGTGDLRLGVNTLADGITSIGVDATNQTTGERCRLTVAVPPVGQPNAVDLDPFDAQGYCSGDARWTLRIEHHIRPNGDEAFFIRVRILDAGAGQRWHTRTTLNGALAAKASSTTGADGIVTAGVGTFQGQSTEPLGIETAGVTATKPATGEFCKVDFTVPPLV